MVMVIIDDYYDGDDNGYHNDTVDKENDNNAFTSMLIHLLHMSVNIRVHHLLVGWHFSPLVVRYMDVKASLIPINLTVCSSTCSILHYWLFKMGIQRWAVASNAESISVW